LLIVKGLKPSLDMCLKNDRKERSASSKERLPNSRRRSEPHQVDRFERKKADNGDGESNIVFRCIEMRKRAIVSRKEKD
jgi:hypothetical protein